MKVMKRVDENGKTHLRKCTDDEAVQCLREGWSYTNRDEWKRLDRLHLQISKMTKEVIL